LGQDKAQAIIDEITKAYECAGQVGFPPQYGYIHGMIPTVVAPVVNAPPYGQPPSSAFVRPGGLGAPGVLPFQPPQGAPASSGNVPQPETSSPPSSVNAPTGPPPPGALPPPGGSASFNAPNLPPQYPPGQPPRGVKRQMEE
ncbi:2838_t:CDS:2, partial [Dentiscutata heterogama]